MCCCRVQVEYKGDPLEDFQTINFLDKYADLAAPDHYMLTLKKQV